MKLKRDTKNKKTDIFSDIIELIIQYARGNFEQRLHTESDDDQMIGLTTGLNMLGEHLMDYSEKLSLQNNIYHDLIENTTEMIFSTDLAGNLIYANQVFRDTLQLSDENVAGRNLCDFLHPEHRKYIRKQFESFVANPALELYEWDFMTSDGRMIVTSGILSLCQDKSNSYSIRGNFRDISNLRRTEKAMYENRMKFESVFDNAMDAIIILDSSFHISKLNPAAEKLFGSNPRKMSGKDFARYVTTDSISYILKLFDHLENSEVDLSYSSLDNPILMLNRNGNEFPVEVSLSKIYLENENFYNLIIRDISRQVERENKLHELNKELELFIYKASHDLKSPFTSSRGLINVALIETGEVKTKYYLKLLDKTLRKGQDLLEDLTRLTLIKQGKVEIVTLDFDEIIESLGISLGLHREAIKKLIKVKYQLSKPLESDHFLLSTILRNLIQNSLKYARNISTSKQIVTVTVNSTSKGIKISVKDEGEGIPEHLQEKIFEMFFRAHENSPGTGLGLYLVSCAVDKLGGSIELKSAPGKGSEFSIFLP